MCHRFTSILWLQAFDMMIGIVIMMWLMHDNKTADASDQLLTSAHVCFTLVLSFQGFYSAPRCLHCKHCTSYNNSVCLSVCHTPELCQNDCT